MTEQRKSGLERIRDIVEGRRDAPFGTLVGFAPVEAEEGMVVFEGAPNENHYNPQGIVHGGFAAAMLDSCLGCAIETMLDADTSYTTVELKVNYVRAMTSETGTVRATGTVIHAGRRMATSEGRLVDRNGRLIAHGSTTCMVFPLPGGS
jgi:uncharacterized protein (TIGR00369 family)